MTPTLNHQGLQTLIQLADQAGQAIMEIYQRDSPMQQAHKSDSSPLTEADLAAFGAAIEDEFMLADEPDARLREIAASGVRNLWIVPRIADKPLYLRLWSEHVAPHLVAATQ